MLPSCSESSPRPPLPRTARDGAAGEGILVPGDGPRYSSSTAHFGTTTATTIDGGGAQGEEQQGGYDPAEHRYQQPQGEQAAAECDKGGGGRDNKNINTSHRNDGSFSLSSSCPNDDVKNDIDIGYEDDDDKDEGGGNHDEGVVDNIDDPGAGGGAHEPEEEEAEVAGVISDDDDDDEEAESGDRGNIRSTRNEKVGLEQEEEEDDEEEAVAEDRTSTASAAAVAPSVSSSTGDYRGHVHVVGAERMGAAGGGYYEDNDDEDPSHSTASTSATASATALSLDLSHFYEAMAMMNPTERRGWDEAQSRCHRSVLDHECCPCYFLRANQHNPWDAAAMACAYWNERITLFQDRAFDPLTIGGASGGGSDSVGGGGDDATSSSAGGAASAAKTEPTGLSREDVDVLETGCMQLLPSDAEGRSVLYLDRSLLQPHQMRMTVPRLRVLWYLFQKAYTNPGHSNAYKLVVLGLVCRPPNGGYDFSFPARGMRIAASLPIHIENYHLLTLPAVSGTGRMLQTVLAVSAGMLGKYFQSQTKVHHGATATTSTTSAADPQGNPNDALLSSPPSSGKDGDADASTSHDPRQQLLQKLQTYGLDKKGLPECAGGVFTLESFKNWLATQRKLEHRAYCTIEERSQRKREINRIHSRQKRQRRRQEFSDLQERAQALERDNDRARRDNSQLEALLYTASGMIQSLAGSSSHHHNSTIGHHGVPSATYSPMMTSSSETASIPVHASASVASHRQPGLTNPPSFDPRSPDDQDYNSLLAALEPDPIAPYHHLPKASMEWEPDPIAPSCNPKTSSSSSSSRHASHASDELKRLSRAFASWHGPDASSAHDGSGDRESANVHSSTAAGYQADSVSSHGGATYSHVLQNSSMDARMHNNGAAGFDPSGSCSRASTAVAAASAASSYPSAVPSSSTVKLPTPSSTLQSLFPFFYKTNTADQPPPAHQQQPTQGSAPSVAPIPSATSDVEIGGTTFSQYWTLYASNANDDELPSLSTPAAATATTTSHEVDPDLSHDDDADVDPLQRLEKWDDGNGGGLFSLLKSDDNDAFEPLDHRIAWDQFV